ncbi:ion transporter [Pseudofrancisella aestuarii]|uniref:Ion transporter n=1 Tax=Pseudofrancisella aestuarii TaxID=2670347 RepID=A0ABV9TDW0_9GAMM|nr:ion transporter [Pseudofrancisella aestuarii]
MNKERIYQFIIVSLVMLNTVTLIAQIDIGNTLFLHYINVSFSLLFCTEYSIRLIASKSKIKFVFSFYNIIDFIAIFIPLILDIFGVNSQQLIVLRLLRIFKIFQNTTILNRIVRVLKKVYLEILVSFSLMFVILVISCVIMFYAEHDAQPEVFSSISNTLWWGIATLTTVGYGDMYPITLLGKLVASGLAILGIGVFAIPSGLIGASFIDEIRREREEKEKQEQEKSKN